MTEQKVDMEFVQGSWESPSALAVYEEAGLKAILLDAERLLCLKYFSFEDCILDIGCGAGRTTFGLYRLGYENIRGVDLSSGMIDRALALADVHGYPITFERGNAVSLGYANDRFDGALFFAQALMCIPGYNQRLNALKQVRRILRPGGHFIFTTHERHSSARWAEFWEEEEARWNEGRQDPRFFDFGDRIVELFGVSTFVHIPTRGDVIKMVQEAGLELVENLMRSEIETETDPESYVDSRMWVVRCPS